jgi:activator of HSP90 ATPase
MTIRTCNRRDFSLRLASLLPAFGIAQSAFGTVLAARGERLAPPPPDEIIHNAGAIHQEVVFKAARKRVYEALTDAKQFDKIIQLSAAIRSGMALPKKPTEINAEPGGAFTIYGGHIVGRHIELVPGERIVQAWRVVVWDPGVYSIAKFVLVEDGASTKLVFDHTGFPIGQAEHLAEGWKGNYWEPLEKYLAQ